MRNVIRSSLPQEIKDSLNASWKEGVVAQVMITIFDYYLIPYALFLGATTQEVGFLVAIPNLMSALAQFFSVRAVDITGSRRSVMLYTIGIQAILLIPVVLLAFIPVGGKIVILTVLMTFYRVLGSILGPAWGSLMSHYLPEGQRGQYFGWRQRMVSIAGIIGVSFWGIVLSVAKNVSQDFGFVLLFSAAVVFRFISFYLSTKMVDMPIEKTPGSDFTFWMFVRRFRESNFVKFILYVSSITFTVQLCAPYFSVRMLKDLHFGYISYMAVNLASVVASLIAFPLWGRNADIVGNAKVLKSTAFLLPIIPVFWMFATNVYELVAIEMLSGFIFSGFTLATSNFIYDAVTPAKRVQCLSYYNIINGAAVFAGATLGGYLAERLPPLLGYPLVTLFLLSAIGRFLADLILSRHFGEVRASTVKIKASELYLSVVGIRPMEGMNVEPEVFPDIRPPREDYHGSGR
jgi:MFS family permease